MCRRRTPILKKIPALTMILTKLRHAATHALLTRRDVIIIGFGFLHLWSCSPEFYSKLIIPVEVGQQIDMEKIIELLVGVQYERND